MKKKKYQIAGRILSILLTALVAGTALSAGAFAEELPETASATVGELPADEAETEQKNVSPEEADPYRGAAIDVSALHRLDFSSCRILVGTQDESIFADPSVLVSAYNGIYILQLTSQQEAARAYAYYFDKADFVEVDTTVTIAEGEGEGASETLMTAEENPFTELENTLPLVDGAYDIALIDTGVPEGSGIDAVSVIGENTADDNGHGSQMLGCILGQNPDAGVLSIKALNSDGRGDVSGIYAAMQLAMERGVRIINLSLSALASMDSRVIEDAIREAIAQGILVVGAAGNNRSNAEFFIPGRVEEAMIVGAAKEDGTRREISNYGPTVDYYVMAEATSNAAATMSGWLSANDPAQIESVLDGGLIFRSYDESAGSAGNSIPLPPATSQVSAAWGGNGYVTDKNFDSFKGAMDAYLGVPYVSPSQIDFNSGSMAGADCSGFVSAMVYWFYLDRAADFPYAYACASAWWEEELLNRGTDICTGYSEADVVTQINNGSIKPGDIVIFGDYIHVAIVYDVFCDPNNPGASDATLIHAYGDRIQKNTLRQVWQWDGAGLRAANDAFTAAGQGTYPKYDVFRGVKQETNGWLQVYKFSTDTAATDGNSNYSIRGAKFTVYNESDQAVGTLTAGANGYTNKIELPAGRYLIKETQAPESGYYIEPQWAAGQWVTVTAEHTETAPLVTNIGDTPVKPSLKLKKESANPQITEDNACYSLAGAVYTVYKDAACKQTAATLTTDAAGSTPAITLPMGTYYVKETKAPQNYLPDSTVHTVRLTASHTASSPYVLRVTDVPGKDPGMIGLTKESNADYATAFPLEGAQFAIKYYDNTAGDTTGAPKRTWLIETRKNARGEFKAELTPEYLAEGSDALYFDNGSPVIPIGTISVEEIRPAAGYTLTEATLKDGDGKEIELLDGRYISTITMQNGMAKLNYGNYYTMLNTPIELHTAAANMADGSHYAKAGAPVTIVDTVTMAGTDAERMINGDGEWDYIHYRLKGELREVGTNEKIADMTDPDTGRPYKNFITDDFDGHKEFMECRIEDPSGLEGKTLYIAENLYTVITKKVDGQRQEIETLIATEDESLFPDKMDTDMKESQRIHFPTIGTTFEGEGITHRTVRKTLTLTDTVAYRALIPGHTYQVTGVLMDKGTGKELPGSDGRPCTKELTFTPTAPEGTVDLTFTIDAESIYGGKTLVAFEELRFNGLLIAEHKDPEDKAQTVKVLPPELHTTLINNETHTHTAKASQVLTLTDTVAYKGLEAGTEYELKGTLMNKETGKPAADSEGRPVTATTRFRAEAAEGRAEVTFTFGNPDLAGGTLVAFEQLYEADTQIADHSDLNDEAQTVRFKTTPKTGNAEHLLLWIVLALAGLSSAAAAVAVRLRKAQR